MTVRARNSVLFSLICLSVSLLLPQATQASPSPQTDGTATPESPRNGPTYTPTPTLPPAPDGGGLVAVDALAVLPEPYVGSGYIGDLVYGDVVFPLAISADGHWVAIFWEFREDRPGWIAASRVNWGPAVNLLSLPILTAPYLITPAPGTPTPAPSLVATSGAPSTHTVSPLPAASPTEKMVAVPVSTLPLGGGEGDGGEVTPSGDKAYQPYLVASIIGVVILLFAYLVLFFRGVKDRGKFVHGFIAARCPVCDHGELSLDETERRTLGISQMRRSVRCDHCHSILRQVRPGIWRYNVDPFIDSELADSYVNREISEAELQKLVTERLRSDKMGNTPKEEADDALVKAREVVAELEARFIAEKSQENKANAKSADVKKGPDDEPSKKL